MWWQNRLRAHDGPLPCAGDCDADGTSGNFAHDCAHHAQEDREYQERHGLVEDDGWERILRMCIRAQEQARTGIYLESEGEEDSEEENFELEDKINN